jgi:predicted nucleic-acid-binding protein
MIGLDTNVLIRYLVQDDQGQARAASKLIEKLTTEVPGYISLVVLAETVWVLVRGFKASREQIITVIRQMLQTAEFDIESKAAVYLALGTYEAGNADFVDALIAHGGRLAGCTETVTFDKHAAANAGMRLLRSA